MTVKSLQTSFVAGELTPSLYARVDLEKYQQGAKRLYNFKVLPHGGAAKRSGFLLLDSIPGEAVLIKFAFNQEQSYSLVFGERWLRFFTKDGPVLDNSGQVYQITSPYTLEQAKKLSTAQSADTMFLACWGVAPHKLIRLNHNIWYFEPILFTSPITPPDWNPIYNPGRFSLTPVSHPGTGSYSTFIFKPGDTGLTLWGGTPPYATYITSKECWPVQITVEGNTTPVIYVNTAVRPPAAVIFINEAKKSDGSISPAQLITPYDYYVTAVDAEGRESGLSVKASIVGPSSNNWQTGDYITMAWSPVPNAEEYRIYKAEFGGQPGFIGSTSKDEFSFKDDNKLPALTEGAPTYRNPFENGDYPALVDIFEQRLVFASTPKRPQTIWLSKSGDYFNFASYSLVSDDSPIELTLASNEVSSMSWLVALRGLIMGSTNIEWEIAGVNGAFSAKNAKASVQSRVGSIKMPAITVNNSVLHISRAGNQVREFKFDFASDSYNSIDCSILADHLLRNNQIVCWSYQQHQDSVIWIVRDDGILLGMTYQAEHKVVAWHQHRTEGQFKSICVIPAGTEDILMAVVQRQGGFFVEKMDSDFNGGDYQNHSFLDCALKYSSSQPVTHISGLNHLEGQTVGILADGAVINPQVVVNGAITLDRPAYNIIVGLLYVAEIETMPIEMYGQQGSSVGYKKQINALDISFDASLGAKVGLSFNKLIEVKWRNREPYGSPPSLFTGIKNVMVPGLGENRASACLRSESPTPVTVLSISATMDVKQ